MLYPDLFLKLEHARWNMQNDINWNEFDQNLITTEQP